MDSLIPIHQPLKNFVRWGPWLHRQKTQGIDGLFLVGFGAITIAISASVKGNFGLPGHHILLIMPVLAFGLAVAPRRNGGMMMSLGALSSICALASFGRPLGFGATTSSLLAGPLIDLFCTRREHSHSPILGILAAALLTNSAAFSVRALRRMAAIDSKPMETWLPKAILSYPIFAIIAALSALLLFRVNPREKAGAT